MDKRHEEVNTQEHAHTRTRTHTEHKANLSTNRHIIYETFVLHTHTNTHTLPKVAIFLSVPLPE